MQMQRYRSRAATAFMRSVGVVMALTALAFPITTLLAGWGLLGEPPWGFWSGIAGAFFFALASVEFFTGQVLGYAGELLRRLGERVTK